MTEKPEVTPTQVAAVGHMRDALIKIVRFGFSADEMKTEAADALAHAGIDLSQGPDAAA